MSEIKKEAPAEEIFDQELKEIFDRGNRRKVEVTAREKPYDERTDVLFVDADMEPVVETVEPEKKASWCRVKASACLLGADALLMFMCLADKIELAYGLVFLAAASAFLGAKVNNARL